MCLLTFRIKPKKAKEEIVCYKIYRLEYIKSKTLYSAYFDYPTRVGELLYNDEIKEVFPHGMFVHCVGAGYFHSFKHLRSAIRKRYEFSKHHTGHYVVVKCTIPQGSLYYAGSYEFRVSYASEQLRIEEILDI